MPNLENIRLWVTALRSGDYRQGIGSLYNISSGTYCCLGVACEVARANGVALEIADDPEPGGDRAYDNESAFLPSKVQAWLGVDSRNPIIDGNHATEWNDGLCASLDKIADAIEREYLA